jgi:hypothetical protein
MQWLVVLGLIPWLAAGCTRDSGSSFRLPDGDAQRGRDAFVALRCHACHDVEGLDAPFAGTGAARVSLGGEITRVRTYGDLVTSIINPSHRITRRYPAEQVAPDGRSLMELARLNDVMTVQQLIDVVAFLESAYRVVPPAVYPYTYYYP